METEDYRSIYFRDYRPFKRTGPNQTTQFATTPRIDHLAQPKLSPYQHYFWTKVDLLLPQPVNPATGQYAATDRIRAMSLPKLPSQYYVMPCCSLRHVARPALTASATERVAELARPVYWKTHAMSMDTIIDLDMTRPITSVSQGAKKADASERVNELATPKTTRAQLGRCTIWTKPRDVSMNVTASDRTAELAKPKTRDPLPFDEDPFGYIVKRSALKAVITPRVDELATPKRR